MRRVLDVGKMEELPLMAKMYFEEQIRLAAE